MTLTSVLCFRGHESTVGKKISEAMSAPYLRKVENLFGSGLRARQKSFSGSQHTLKLSGILEVESREDNKV